jgi:hypothetical protein
MRQHLAFLIISVLARTTVTQPVADYYPLQVGNEWVYLDSTVKERASGVDISTSVRSITVKTTIATTSGEVCYRFEDLDVHGMSTARMDEGRLYCGLAGNAGIMVAEFVMADFTLPVGEEASPDNFRYRVDSIFTETWFGEDQSLISISHLVGTEDHVEGTIHYADGIGPVRSHTPSVSSIPGYYSSTLLGCVVNGRTYGPTAGSSAAAKHPGERLVRRPSNRDGDRVVTTDILGRRHDLFSPRMGVLVVWRPGTAHASLRMHTPGRRLSCQGVVPYR